MKVAIVHDWFIGWGAEGVVYELHKMYPQAPIFTAYCNDEWRQRLAPAPVITSYMQRWPFSKLRKFLPVLRAVWFSRLNLDGYDLVISSSGAEAKAVRVKKPALHINYCHAPTHYYWSRYEQYMVSPGFGLLNPVARLGLKLLVGPMRNWDKKAAQRADYLVANSNYTKDQIKKYYGRESVVVHPPVDIEAFAPKSQASRQGFIIAGRQTPYKRFDLAVAACTELGLPLVVIGDGPEHRRLKKLAGPSIKFVGSLKTRAEVAHYIQRAEAFIFPGLDDFGIVAVEALAAGTPVIAYGEGGALDYVKPGRTGELFKPQTSAALAQKISAFEASGYDSGAIIKSASAFSPSNFRSRFENFLKDINPNK